MQVLEENRVVSTTDAVSDCPECGALRDTPECVVCGWQEPTAEHKPAPRAIEKPPEVRRRPNPNIKIDAGNDLVCEQCGADREEVAGVLRCPICEPEPITRLPRRATELPNIDDKLPADPRCPHCIAQASTAVNSNISVNPSVAPSCEVRPVDIGERMIVTDYDQGGAIMLVCPVCNASETLVPGRNHESKQTRAPQGGHVPDSQSKNTAGNGGENRKWDQAEAAQGGEGPSNQVANDNFQVKRRKKG